ncbi:hypothetical protein Bca4012_063082 [Brassica carinata]
MKGSRNSTSFTPIILSFISLFIFNLQDIYGVPTKHLCRPAQRDALLQFKNELEIQNVSCTIDDLIVFPQIKTKSWISNMDCCYWDGVTCDTKSGQVIELDLSCSGLHGQFPSNNSLSRLRFLNTLDLSHNNFRGQFLSSFESFYHLTNLNLSENYFSGFIPSSLGNLSHLTSLLLSKNNFVGTIPYSLGNLPSLTSLDLSNNNLVGAIPSCFGNLNQLTTLVVDYNKLSGSFPVALLNLTKLSDISLSENQFTGTLPSNITLLSKLNWFSVSHNTFTGNLPSSLFNIPSLYSIDLTGNQLSILEFENISSPSNLDELRIGSNNFRGQIPRSIIKLANLSTLDISYFNTQGPVDFSIFRHLPLDFLGLSHLNTTTTIDLCEFASYITLDLSGNRVSPKKRSEDAFPYVAWIVALNLSGCGLTEFPELLRNRGAMMKLDISNNKIEGKVPGWFWRIPQLSYVNLSNNNLTGFERSLKPILSSLEHLLGFNNNFMGSIPSFLCGFHHLTTLDFSNNNFNGSIPRCIGNIKSFLSVLNLRHNRLSGSLPENRCKSLRSLDVGHNQLVGKLPKSLIHCSTLEVLNVESNRINDTFPFWLSSMKELQVLVLRSNAFHGPIHQTWYCSKLHIIDISHNHFRGTLPSDFFVNWTDMSSLGTNEDRSKEQYMGDGKPYYHDSMVLMNKGIEMEMVRILKIYRALDFSGNEFEGDIPVSIGLLKELIVLNLSNNAFRGRIPSSTANLTALESLDFSQNKLSGEIPQELGNLSYLAYMNFSHNQLVGLVPGGTQFRRQACSSFEGNSGLFGPSLDEDCRDIHAPAPQPHETLHTEEEAEEEEEGFSWIAAALGYVPGIAFGVMVGYILASYKPDLFVSLFGRKKRKTCRQLIKQGNVHNLK